jgi:ssDNA-binding Zn-finger/Zn-ribbon topoisomerase 1
VNPLKLIKKKLITRGTVLKTPALGRCPKCGSPLYLAKSSLGNYAVCSNPLCNYYRKVEE